MLSIGKLGVGHCAYYEQSVADGREDYYTGKGEEQGWFLGAGSEALGLDGELAHGDLSTVMRGKLPDGSRWVQRQQQNKTAVRALTLADGTVIERKAPQSTAAFDLTFSAPKSVSVLWGLSDGSVAADVRAAHVEAVRQAFGYLERTACVTRRGKAGREHIRGEGFVGAAFTHRTSRAGDPQLHTHVIIANATRATSRGRLGRDITKYSALHGTLLYREAKTASYLYQATLRRELTRRLGVEWTPVHKGICEVAGIDHALCATFSKRSEEITRQLAIAGHTSARAANAAAIDTRAAKSYGVDGAHLKDRWYAEARSIDAPDILDALAHASSSSDQASDWPNPLLNAQQLGDELFAPDGLTHTKTTFHRRDVIQAVAQAAPRGATVEQIEQHADRVIDHAADRIALLGPKDPIPRGSSLRADGAKLVDGRADRAFTTRELLAKEQAIITAMRDRAHDNCARVPTEQVRHVLNARPEHRKLAPDQRGMVETLTTSGAGIQVVVGLGGAGKTFSLEAAHDAWKTQGINVRGCSIADAAARNLHAETGIESRTIATLKLWAEPASGSGYPPRPDKAFPSGGVLVVDEAGMVPTRDLAFLVEGCARHDTKLVLIGDHHQLPEIEAGGSFKSLVHRFDTEGRVERLTTNRRQHHDWERAALGDLRAGDLGRAITTYADQGRIHSGSDPAELRERLVAHWLRARDKHPQVAMIAYTRHDTQHLNQLARDTLDAHGHLGHARVSFAGTQWAVGDELLCLRNNHALGLSNGTRGTVSAVGVHAVQITTPAGKQHTIPSDYLHHGHAAYGYAATGHKSQGQTINGDAFVLASDHISREWLYVALSRAKDASHIYIDTPARDPETGHALTPTQQHHTAILDLHLLASRSDAHTLATDHREISTLTTRELATLADRDGLTDHQRTALHAESTRREGALRDKLLSDPPLYLLPAIGPAPLDATKRQEWARDAARLEQHRERHGLNHSAMTTTLADKVLGRHRGHGRGHHR